MESASTVPLQSRLCRASITFYGIAATGSYIELDPLRDAPPGGEAFFANSNLYSIPHLPEKSGNGCFFDGQTERAAKKGEKRKFLLILQETTLQTPLNML
ncbi:hypothetical protein KQI10_01335 [Pseudoflavonifractor sp. MSJ-30]|uniref:hypothetical protein n=1 Tax=Pseudoflavonifractor sp. MSJ-30 TaxID=2841525 RepID=UPI001C112418|nr:hypothetical protein [Pseudoflavonifractor sp. MSJ-30]MBU5451819.1 hypothetical protein [Pseudoflavonifractor sp. MSJ-30]